MRIEFDERRRATGLLGRDQRRAGAAERIEYDAAFGTRVADQVSEQGHGLHRRVFAVAGGFVEREHGRLRPVAEPRVGRPIGKVNYGPNTVFLRLKTKVLEPLNMVVNSG